MVVTIHQPEHLPWTGFFHKMSQADVYVLLDVVQFTKNNWQNRNQLVDRQGQAFWLTVPVMMKGHTSNAIKDIQIDNQQDWRRKYWGRLEQAYCRHPFYAQYAPALREIVMQPCDRLVDLNLALIRFLREALGLGNRILCASELPVSGVRSELLLDICRKLEAKTYLSGPSGRDYLKQEIFAEAGIALEFHTFKPPVYPAPHYLPALSTLDVLFNHGPASAALIDIQTPARQL
jgi:hypothetical protein